MKLCPARAQRIIAAVAVGATYQEAALAGGVDRSTLWRWIKRGEREDAPHEFLQFCNTIKKAEAEAAMRWLGTINRAAASGTWQAAAWLLERRFPLAYGRRVREHYTDPRADLMKLVGC